MAVPARRRPPLVALSVVLVAFAATCAASNVAAFADSTTTSAPVSATTVVATSTTSAPTSSTTTTAPARTTTTVVKPRPAPTLRIGSSGRLVRDMQRRLLALGYWVGAPNGVFGDSTEQAVYALQKAASLSRDGVVGRSTAAAIARGVRPKPRRTPGYVVEIDLRRDLLMFVKNGKLVRVLNTSTGGGYTYVSGGVSAVATSPIGIFHIFRQVDGLDISPLGQLWRPKYFDGGFAIHGDSYVPPTPVSHGCVRVSNEAIDWIWANNLIPLGTRVWVYS
jgi:lipoprotein-anchoring transpeptidase ErfK/SrfK